ncbi:MAG: hypothetical protein ACR2OR_01780 [Hyphomicrobiales bacterium]
MPVGTNCLPVSLHPSAPFIAPAGNSPLLLTLLLLLNLLPPHLKRHDALNQPSNQAAFGFFIRGIGRLNHEHVCCVVFQVRIAHAQHVDSVCRCEFNQFACAKPFVCRTIEVLSIENVPEEELNCHDTKSDVVKLFGEPEAKIKVPVAVPVHPKAQVPVQFHVDASDCGVHKVANANREQANKMLRKTRPEMFEA